MKLDNMLPYRAMGLGVALLGVVSRATDDLSQAYCSSENTADGSTLVTNIYQSNGACYDSCKASYAFAIVQYQSCWCSNYIPADTTDVGSCNQDCPGYPSEKCGNQGSGLYGYVALPNAPSGTAGASSASSTDQSSTTAPSPTTEPQTSYSSTTRSSSSTMTTSTSTETPVAVVPVTSVIRTVISGAIVTQTVTSTPVAAGGAQSPESLNFHRKNSLGGGAIAGIVIGVLAALAMIGIGAFLLWRRKRKQDGEASGPGNNKNLGRNVSVLSKAGLLARTRPSMGERDHEEGFYNTTATGQNSVRHSMMFGPAAEGVSPVSPLGSSDGSNHSRRMSKPMVYDQRLNPSALFANQEANGSRISMQDAQDYTRPLGVTNPDVRASFESRISRA